MVEKIIEFWFSEANRKKWFVKNENFDQEITDKFSDIHAQAIQCELYEWRESALGALAEVIVLDQFSRNMFRNKPQSFMYDSLALTLAQNAISRHFDLELNQEQRSFLYMPFMHSESLVIHEQAVKLFKDLGNSMNIEFEYKHKAIIERFGRYPHRNKILGRPSTSEEVKFLQQSDSSF